MKCLTLFLKKVKRQFISLLSVECAQRLLKITDRLLYIFLIFFSEISLVETNLSSQIEEKVQNLLHQRLEKGAIYAGGAGVVPLELG